LIIEQYVIAEELHSDGNQHLHAYITLDKRFRSRDPESSGFDWARGRDLSPSYTGEGKEPIEVHSVLQEGWELPHEHDLRSEGEPMECDTRTRKRRRIGQSQDADRASTPERLYNLRYCDKQCDPCERERPSGVYDWTESRQISFSTRLGPFIDSDPTRRHGSWENSTSYPTVDEGAILFACGHVEVVSSGSTRRYHL